MVYFSSYRLWREVRAGAWGSNWSRLKAHSSRCVHIQEAKTEECLCWAHFLLPRPGPQTGNVVLTAMVGPSFYLTSPRVEDPSQTWETWLLSDSRFSPADNISYELNKPFSKEIQWLINKYLDILRCQGNANPLPRFHFNSEKLLKQWHQIWSR